MNSTLNKTAAKSVKNVLKKYSKEQTSGSQASSHIRSRKMHDVANGQSPLDNAPSQSTDMPGSIDKDLSSKNASFLAVAGMTLERQTQV